MPEEQEVYEVEQEPHKVCPLRMIAYNKYPGSVLAQSHVRCITEKCAWWMDYAERDGLHCPPECALNRMAR